MKLPAATVTWLAKLDGRSSVQAAGWLTEHCGHARAELPAVIEAIVGRLADGKRRDRAALWRLTVALVVGLEPGSPFAAPRRGDRFAQQARRKLDGASRWLMRDLAASDQAISAAAAYAVAHLGTPSPGLVKAVSARAAAAPSGLGQTSAILATGQLRRRKFKAKTPAPGATPAARVHHALAETLATGKATAAAAEVLADFVAKARGDARDPKQPWGDGSLAALARAALATAPVAVQPAGHAGLLAAVLATKGRARMVNLEALVRQAFPKPGPLTRKTLREPQREILAALIDGKVDVALPAHGLPTVASVRALISREAMGHPIDDDLTLSVGTRATWQWFEARLKREITDAELTRAVLKRWQGDALWDVVTSALATERGHASPTLAFAEAASGAVTLDSQRLAQAVAATVAAGKACMPARAVFAVLVLVRAGLPPAHAKALSQLARIARAGNDDAVIARMDAALVGAA